MCCIFLKSRLELCLTFVEHIYLFLIVVIQTDISFLEYVFLNGECSTKLFLPVPGVREESLIANLPLFVKMICIIYM